MTQDEQDIIHAALAIVADLGGNADNRIVRGDLIAVDAQRIKTPRERAARAGAAAWWGKPGTPGHTAALLRWDEAHVDDKAWQTHWLRAVDAMLAEIREPSDAMVEAGATQLAMADGYVGKSAPFVWRAMIDTITQPPGRPAT